MTAGLPRGVLFDLDGTLVDSAPDFVATIALMAARLGKPPVSLEQLRPHVSKGSRAMLKASFPEFPEEEREALVPEFLSTYEGLLGDHAPPFESIPEFLAALDDAGVPWGIVTNKPEYLAVQVLDKLDWSERSKVLIGGDTLPVKKPDPLPLIVAAEKMGIAPADIVYVGDDLRDIQAANAAGMRSIAALWGYRLNDENPDEWNACVQMSDVTELMDGTKWPQ